MSDLGMNLVTNDLDIKNGDLYLVSGDDAIQQDLQQTLQVWIGEWFLDTTVGIPFRQDILVKNPNLDLVQANLINAALGVPGVIQILDFNFNYNSQNRSISVFIAAQTSTGQTIQTQVNINAQPAIGTIEGTAY